MAETKPTGAKKHITGARIAQEIKQYKKDALISPLSGRIIPASTFSSVDFPEPFAPVITIGASGATEKSGRSSIVLSSARTVRFFILIESAWRRFSCVSAEL